MSFLNFSGWICLISSHSVKIKHRREGGGYPPVKLLFAERRECGKALALARRMRLYHRVEC